MINKTDDFMLEEYNQIANAYQDLHSQQNELVKSYLKIVAIPASVLTLVIQLLEIDIIDPASLMNSVASVAMPLLLFLMVILSFIGLAVLLALVSIRGEAILYVRTVNCIRRYFVEKESDFDLNKYLVLPDLDVKPPYWEGWSSRSVWNVTIVALLNSFIFFATIFSVFQWVGNEGLGLPVIISIIYLLIQHLLHRKMLYDEEKKYTNKFTTPHKFNKKVGVDLDGVLNDLAGAVISIAQEKYGIIICRNEITSHNLAECTELSKEQINEIFTSSKVFEEVAPDTEAKEALNHLVDQGYEVHILTDRFWGKRDWIIAMTWLNNNNMKWNSLNLVRANDKPKYSEIHDLNVFIEDNFHTACNLASVCDKVFLLDRPYNQGKLPGNVYRVDNWGQIITEV